ncbi:MAG: exodeoxyribonuclease VII large subunit, partial [bacterium]|nr:exodeoxyribonuclease VII large subunit [bacterium]
QSALSPLAVLARGYSVTQNDAGKVVRTTNDVQPGETLRTRLTDGDVISVVSRRESKTNTPESA